jgi:hypothetical protein
MLHAAEDRPAFVSFGVCIALAERGPSLGRSTSSTPCLQWVEKFHLAAAMRTLTTPLAGINRVGALVRSAGTEKALDRPESSEVRLYISIRVEIKLR